MIYQDLSLFITIVNIFITIYHWWARKHQFFFSIGRMVVWSKWLRDSVRFQLTRWMGRPTNNRSSNFVSWPVVNFLGSELWPGFQWGTQKSKWRWLKWNPDSDSQMAGAGWPLSYQGVGHRHDDPWEQKTGPWGHSTTKKIRKSHPIDIQ